jgi:ABC-type lipoprotein release transport system permease subunit
MNGFNGLIFKMLGSFDPDLKVTPVTGKVFNPEAAGIQRLLDIPGITGMSEVLMDNALIRYNGRQVFGTIKGVDDNYVNQTSVENILIDGKFTLYDEVANYATPGIGVASALGIHAGFISPLEIMSPKRNENINLANPAASMNIEYTYIAAVFQCNQQIYDDNYILVPISTARTLFDYKQEVSAIEVKIAKGHNIDAIKTKAKSLLGKDYKVQDCYEQQDAAYKMMQSEKWIIFLIMYFILIISLFNTISSLSMLMIEKQDDMQTLKAMGASHKLIRRIFFFEGWIISGAGACIGIALGLILCLLQQEFGLLKMGEAGTFVVNSYPVVVKGTDLLIVLGIVLLSGLISSRYTVYHLGERWLK